MKRNEKTLPWKEVLNLKDDEFCQNLGVTIEVPPFCLTKLKYLYRSSTR